MLDVSPPGERACGSFAPIIMSKWLHNANKRNNLPPLGLGSLVTRGRSLPVVRISLCCGTIKGRNSPGGAPSPLLLALAVRIVVVDLDGPGLELGEGAHSLS